MFGPIAGLGRYGWTPSRLSVLAVLALLAIWAGWSQWADIFTIAWRDEEASHILLVPPIMLWLIWVRRIRFRRSPPRFSWAGPVLIAIGWATAYFSFRTAFQAGWHGGAVLMLLGAVATVVGTQVLANFAPAVALSAMLIPIPGAIRLLIAGPLQNATARVTRVVLESMGHWVERSGNMLLINEREVAVHEACNGMRMVFALVLVSYAFAYTVPLRNSVRVMILVLSPIAAIVCNVFRLTPTVLLYGYADERIADWFHAGAGWAMLPLAFLILMGITRSLRWALVPTYRFTLAHQMSEGA
ncbi:MAG: exosortase/archaeosortase family protein [Planctomycetota bacterium]